MKKSLECSVCGNILEVEESSVELERFIQCPVCSDISPNPLYKGVHTIED
jgi:DNA-directed RNA polymerase subunit RPC12/RpoP